MTVVPWAKGPGGRWQVRGHLCTVYTHTHARTHKQCTYFSGCLHIHVPCRTEVHADDLGNDSDSDDEAEVRLGCCCCGGITYGIAEVSAAVMEDGQS